MELFNKEQFKGELRLKLRISISFCLFTVLCMLMIYFSARHLDSEEHLKSFITGFQFGIFIAIEGALIAKCLKYRKALKNEVFLEELYIDQHDERTKVIDEKTASSSFTLFVYLLGLATIVSGLFDTTVFLALFGVLVCLVAIKAGFYFYYKNKY